jgi:NAD(P)-dependent dehydrogenase (short-subunit alcohol dehydrogenase family)
LATTKLLSEKGASVAVLDLQEPPEKIHNTKFWKCDVSDDERVETCIKETIQFASNEKKPIAGAVCCAGVAMAGRVST